MIFDQDILKNFLNSLEEKDHDFLLKAFLDEIEQKSLACSQAKDCKNMSLLQSEAHILKSTAMTIGAVSVSKRAEEIEKLCIEGDSKEAFGLCSDLYDLAQKTINTIKRYF